MRRSDAVRFEAHPAPVRVETPFEWPRESKDLHAKAPGKDGMVCAGINEGSALTKGTHVGTGNFQGAHRYRVFFASASASFGIACSVMMRAFHFGRYPRYQPKPQCGIEVSHVFRVASVSMR